VEISQPSTWRPSYERISAGNKHYSMYRDGCLTVFRGALSPQEADRLTAMAMITAKQRYRQVAPSECKLSPYCATGYRDPSTFPPFLSELVTDGRVTAKDGKDRLQGTLPIFGNLPRHVFSYGDQYFQSMEWLGDGLLKMVHSTIIHELLPPGGAHERSVLIPYLEAAVDKHRKRESSSNGT
jgi:hypothetical protein